MLEVFDKTGNTKQLAEKSDLVYVASTGYNTIGSKFQIELDLKPNFTDKACIMIVGSHNTDPFMTMIFVQWGQPNATTHNVYGNTTITSVSSYDDRLTIRIETAMYGSCVVVSPVPILSAPTWTVKQLLMDQVDVSSDLNTINVTPNRCTSISLTGQISTISGTIIFSNELS